MTYWRTVRLCVRLWVPLGRVELALEAAASLLLSLPLLLLPLLLSPAFDSADVPLESAAAAPDTWA